MNGLAVRKRASFCQSRKHLPDLFVCCERFLIRHSPLDLGDLLGGQMDVGHMRVEEREQNLRSFALAIVRECLDPGDGLLKSPVHHRVSAPNAWPNEM